MATSRLAWLFGLDDPGRSGSDRVQALSPPRMTPISSCGRTISAASSSTPAGLASASPSSMAERSTRPRLIRPVMDAQGEASDRSYVMITANLAAERNRDKHRKTSNAWCRAHFRTGRSPRPLADHRRASPVLPWLMRNTVCHPLECLRADHRAPASKMVGTRDQWKAFTRISARSWPIWSSPGEMGGSRSCVNRGHRRSKLVLAVYEAEGLLPDVRPAGCSSAAPLREQSEGRIVRHHRDAAGHPPSAKAKSPDRRQSTPPKRLLRPRPPSWPTWP